MNLRRSILHDFPFLAFFLLHFHHQKHYTNSTNKGGFVKFPTPVQIIEVEGTIYLQGERVDCIVDRVHSQITIPIGGWRDARLLTNAMSVMRGDGEASTPERPSDLSPGP